MEEREEDSLQREKRAPKEEEREEREDRLLSMLAVRDAIKALSVFVGRERRGGAGIESTCSGEDF